MLSMWPNIVIKVPMAVLVYRLGKILAYWPFGRQFHETSTIWHGGHLGFGHRTSCPSYSSTSTIGYTSYYLWLIRKTQPKQSLDSELWDRLGDLGLRKRFRSKRGGRKLTINSLTGVPVICSTTGLPSPVDMSLAPNNSTSDNL